jgi:broad specificity phosphatase PhoE
MEKPVTKWVPRRTYTPAIAPSSPIDTEPKMFMIRHLERIDMSDNTRSPEFEEWKKIREDYDIKINPYLDTHISISRLVKNLEDKKIDHIVCSPYIRCIETAILVVNSRELNITDKTIHIDYKLGELVHPDLSFQKPHVVDRVFENSKRFVEEKYRTMSFTLDNSDNIPLTFEEFETDEEYDKRISNELKEIRRKYSGNILIVTHADAHKQFTRDRKGMDFGIVYNIDLDLTGGYKEKYLKYKSKYLDLKAKLKF